jgi:hypothetical protein
LKIASRAALHPKTQRKCGILNILETRPWRKCVRYKNRHAVSANDSAYTCKDESPSRLLWWMHSYAKNTKYQYRAHSERGLHARQLQQREAREKFRKQNRCVCSFLGMGEPWYRMHNIWTRAPWRELIQMQWVVLPTKHPNSW